MSHLHTVGSICLTSLSTAVTMQGRMWREKVQLVSGDLYRSANPCNRTTVFSLSSRAQHMNGHSNALILELIDSHQSCWARCITFPGSLKSLFPHFILFQIRHALLEECLPQKRDTSRRSFPEPTAETILLTL